MVFVIVVVPPSFIYCVCVCVCVKNKPTTTNKSNQIKSNKYDNQPKRGSGGVGWAGTAKEQQQRNKSKQQAAAAVVVGLVWFGSLFWFYCDVFLPRVFLLYSTSR